MKLEKLNKLLNDPQLNQNEDCRVYLKDKKYQDQISNCPSIQLRKYKSPKGKDKEMVDKMIKIFMSDPDYPINEFVYDLIMYGH